MAKYVILPPLDDMRREFARRLADTIPGLDVVAPETDEEAGEELKDADGAYGWVPPAALAGAKNLKLLQTRTPDRSTAITTKSWSIAPSLSQTPAASTSTTSAITS